MANESAAPAASPAAEARGHAPSEMKDGEAGAVESGGEEHGVAEAEQAGIAEQEVVAHGEDRQHHDAGEHAVMVGRQHEIQPEEKRDHRDVQDDRPCRGVAG